jgi:hypothetical protein
MARERDGTIRITFLLWNFLYEEPVFNHLFNFRLSQLIFDAILLSKPILEYMHI